MSQPKPLSSSTITIEVSPGELMDRISILQIKAERITDPGKLRNIHGPLKSLCEIRDERVQRSELLSRLQAELKAVNQTLWDIEDAIRTCEAEEDFGSRFVEFARAVYRNNDRRAALKRQIDLLLGSEIIEEKSYPTY